MPQRYRYRVDDGYFNEIDTPEKAYWLGFIIADGCISGKSNAGYRLQVTLATKDRGHLLKLRHALGSNHPIHDEPGKGSGGSSRLIIVRKAIYDALHGLGVRPRKSGREWFVPQAMRYETDFWRGVFDGDGHLKYKGHGGKYHLMTLCGSRELLEAFSRYCQKIVPHERAIYNHGYAGDVNYFTLVGDKAKKVISQMYSDSTMSLSRKQNEADLIIGRR